MNQFPKTQDLILNNKNGWLEILFNNAVNRNSLKESLVEELLIVFDVAKDNKDIRAIFLRGDGGVFCAGADLKKMKKITESGKEAKNQAYDFSMTIGKLLKVINQAPQIVVSVTEGFALAGGFGIACASDFVISLENTKFGLTETKIGLTPSQISKYVINKLGYSHFLSFFGFLGLGSRIILNVASLMKRIVSCTRVANMGLRPGICLC